MKRYIISPYNINYGRINPTHVGLLKKQIENGSSISVRYYENDGLRFIIDGGHAFTAYTELGKEPPILIEVPYTTPEDMLAISRHCNVNRIKQAPVSYTESIVDEVMLRLEVGVGDVKSVFYKYQNIKDRGDKDDGNVPIILDTLFEQEKIALITFRKDYLPLLDLPEEIKISVDKGEINKSHAIEIAKVKSNPKQQVITKIIKEKELSVRDTKNLVKRIENKKETPERAVQIIFEKKAEEAKHDATIYVEKKPHVAHNAGENEWYTPPEYINAARLTMGGIDCDPASHDKANEIVQAKEYFTKERDGLKQKWHGRVWMNPPYAQPLISQFSMAIVSKYRSGKIEQACILVNNATETAWFQEMMECCECICFIRGRVRFLDVDGKPGAPLQGQAVIYLGDKQRGFVDNFSKFGLVMELVPREDTKKFPLSSRTKWQ